jgi:hypothetical protein
MRAKEDGPPKAGRKKVSMSETATAAGPPVEAGVQSRYELEPETTGLLVEVRSGRLVPATCGLRHSDGQRMVHDVCLPLMNAEGLTLVEFDQYTWFYRELARVLRTKRLGVLANELVVLLNKWTMLGLSSRFLQRLTCACLAQLASPACGQAPVLASPAAVSTSSIPPPLAGEGKEEG